ncbi:hypothetical protein B8W99_26445 [Peribacillus simplex]|nr:hypothetical protein B8W99_26445 [Peribacillus simplex]
MILSPFTPTIYVIYPISTLLDGNPTLLEHDFNRILTVGGKGTADRNQPEHFSFVCRFFRENIIFSENGALSIFPLLDYFV